MLSASDMTGTLECTTLTFPCQYPINIITLALNDQQREQIHSIMQQADPHCTYSMHASKGNNYQSYRFRIEATGQKQLQKLHTALVCLPFVKMVL